MKPIRNVCVFGVGGVGGYFGNKMASAIDVSSDKSNIKLHFIARGEHLRAIQADGLTLVTTEKTTTVHPTLATDSINDIPSSDLILLCVKSYDLPDAIEAINANVNPKTIIIPLLNGADVYERVRDRIHTGTVLPACVYVGTHIASPGVIQQNGGDGKILLGPDPQAAATSMSSLKDFFESAKVNYQWQENPLPAIWGKYIFIAGLGMVTVYKNQTLGEMLADAHSMSLLRSIMKEIQSLAKAKGIPLPENIVELSIEKAKTFPGDTKTSYHRDVERKGSINEGDLYGETIIRMANTLGVSTPVSQSLHSKIANTSKSC